jgi:formamidopyrimidine-DNA glycosylase
VIKDQLMAGKEDTMPELPDVEVFTSYFTSTSLHKKINSIDIKNKKVLENTTASVFKQKVNGDEFAEAARHGKYLFARLKKNGWVLFHFGMTGLLKYFKEGSEIPRHTRVLFGFKDGYYLSFVNQRLLGKVGIINEPARFIGKKHLGEDALKLSEREFENIFKRGRGYLKTTLMNQSMLAGIGNIYADEILFQAKIHPAHDVNALHNTQIEHLYKSMNKILKIAIEKKGGSNHVPGLFSHSSASAEHRLSPLR